MSARRWGRTWLGDEKELADWIAAQKMVDNQPKTVTRGCRDIHRFLIPL